MKKRRIISMLSTIIGMILGCLPLHSQAVLDGQIPFRVESVEVMDSIMEILIDLDISHLQMNTNSSLELSPTLIGIDGTKFRMESILLNGKKRHKAFKREMKLKGSEHKINQFYYTIIKLDNANRKILQYKQTILFEAWMNDARLEVESELCGCGGHTQQFKTDVIAERIIVPEETVKPQIYIAYIHPKVEEIKNRSEVKDVFLDFPVNKTVILPGYGNNPRELQNIEEIIRELRSDHNLTVRQIDITGYASPEGSVSLNMDLAKGRAEALKNYLFMKGSVFSGRYIVNNGGEDWTGLVRLLEQSSGQRYIDEMLFIIGATHNVEERKLRLKAVDGGRIWNNELKRYYFPQLRRVVCQINYEVRNFSVEEATEIFYKHPQQLSLEEMFRVANTYPKESPEFAEIFETAVRLFPDNSVANLNAAAIALSRKDFLLFEKYLKNADKTMPEYINNLGVFYLLTNQLEEAWQQFKIAAEKGSYEAIQNLESFIK